MITQTYMCDLCKNEVNYPHGGYRLVFSGCGGIKLVFLDDVRASSSIICKECVRGLQYAMSHIPTHPDEADEAASES